MAKEIMSQRVILNIAKDKTVTMVEHSYEVESTDEPGSFIGSRRTHKDRGETGHNNSAKAAENVLKANPALNAFVNSLDAAAKTREGI